MAGVRRWKRVCTDACHVAGAVQEAYEPGMFGDQRADFLRTVAFWSIRSSGFLR